VRRELGFAAAAGALGWCSPAAAPVVPAVAAAFRLQRRLEPRRGIALTFDDGPHPHGTPAVLDLLAAASARGTFFLVGEQVERHPTVAAEIVAAGHEIGVHGYRHVLLLRRTPASLREDYARAAATIGEATGTAPRLYRPPYGVFSLAALGLVRRRGWTALLWSKWGRDWELRARPKEIACRATRGLAPGDVVLLHDSDSYSSADSWRRTVGALPFVLDAARATGEELVSASHST
jgi:peptidoglycan/xylan/chitin deacetylase (PgdA/CDA1 family)